LGNKASQEKSQERKEVQLVKNRNIKKVMGTKVKSLKAKIRSGKTSATGGEGTGAPIDRRSRIRQKNVNRGGRPPKPALRKAKRKKKKTVRVKGTGEIPNSQNKITSKPPSPGSLRKEEK